MIAPPHIVLFIGIFLSKIDMIPTQDIVLFIILLM